MPLPCGSLCVGLAISRWPGPPLFDPPWQTMFLHRFCVGTTLVGTVQEQNQRPTFCSGAVVALKIDKVVDFPSVAGKLKLGNLLCPILSGTSPVDDAVYCNRQENGTRYTNRKCHHRLRE